MTRLLVAAATLLALAAPPPASAHPGDYCHSAWLWYAPGYTYRSAGSETDLPSSGCRLTFRDFNPCLTPFGTGVAANGRNDHEFAYTAANGVVTLAGNANGSLQLHMLTGNCVTGTASFLVTGAVALA